MKKLFLFAIVLFVANLVKAQWEPDVRLTNSADSSMESFGRTIAASGDTVHVTWYDKRDGNWEIYYKRSVDGGLTWDPDTRLTNDPALSKSPAIAISGSFVHVVWCDNRDGNNEIYYMRSTDRGSTWEGAVRITNDVFWSYSPKIAVSGSYVHVVWSDKNLAYNLMYEVHYRSSADAGINWGTETSLSSFSTCAYAPAIAADGSNIHIFWNDFRDMNLEIYYRHSGDGGLTWDPDTRLTSDPRVSTLPCVSVSGSKINIVWMDTRNHPDVVYDIYLKRSIDGGLTWGPDTRLTSSNGTSVCPNISASGSLLHLIWQNDRDGNRCIYYKSSADNGLTWTADLQLNNVSVDSQYPFIAVSGPVLHTMWQDFRDSNFEIYYKRNPTGGFPVGVDNELAGNSGQPITIYPNPACTVLNIDFSSVSDENLDVRIINIFGQTVGIYKFNSSKGSNQYKTDLNDLSNGLYLIEFTSGEQKQFKKLLIRK